jgi:putative phosphoribosyl transferase
LRHRFHNRAEAGRRLAANLAAYANRPDVLVLALPRGGVPVAFEVARALHAPLDVVLVRKLGVPGHEELAMGAIASGEVRVLNDDVVEWLGISNAVIDQVAAAEQQELERRERAYRGDRPALDVRDRMVILVDDGLATGTTMHAAVVAVRQQQPARIVVAVPTVALASCAALRSAVDAIIWVIASEPFYSVGSWYDDFTPPTDDEVHALLVQPPPAPSPTPGGANHSDQADRCSLQGPEAPVGGDATARRHETRSRAR